MWATDKGDQDGDIVIKLVGMAPAGSNSVALWEGELAGAYLPPNSCIPRRAKTTMKRKRRKSKLMIDFMELIKDTTKFRSEAQYLRNPGGVREWTPRARPAPRPAGQQPGGLWHRLCLNPCRKERLQPPGGSSRGCDTGSGTGDVFLA